MRSLVCSKFRWEERKNLNDKDNSCDGVATQNFKIQRRCNKFNTM